MSKHANEAGNKENVNLSPALHVKKKKKNSEQFISILKRKMKKVTQT